MFQYEFRFEDTKLSYKYSRSSNQELRDEELSVNGEKNFLNVISVYENTILII